MHLKAPGLAAVALLAAVAAGPTAGAATRLPGTIEIPCAAHVLDQDADWYLPEGEPRALVWIQHGFARTGGNVADLAATFADAGHLVFAPSLPFMNLSGCTLQNIGDNTAFLHHVATLFGAASAPTGRLSTSLTAAARRAGRAAPAIPENLVFIGHSAGAEAVAYVAERLRTHHLESWNTLRGVVLLDPVRSFLGNNIDLALTGLDTTTLPALTISAPPSPCNTFGIGTLAVQTRLHRPFLGVRLPSGAHTDAEGSSSDTLGEMLCGTPEAMNSATLRTLALGWVGDFLTGTPTPDYYPAAPHGAVPAAPGAQPLTGL
ncbi:alpha/beta fold hydrolase [Nocardia sp. IFM 10818]